MQKEDICKLDMCMPFYNFEVIEFEEVLYNSETFDLCIF